VKCVVYCCSDWGGFEVSVSWSECDCGVWRCVVGNGVGVIGVRVSVVSGL
jgi:hypothetical protein